MIQHNLPVLPPVDSKQPKQLLFAIQKHKTNHLKKSSSLSLPVSSSAFHKRPLLLLLSEVLKGLTIQETTKTQHCFDNSSAVGQGINLVPIRFLKEKIIKKRKKRLLE